MRLTIISLVAFSVVAFSVVASHSYLWASAAPTERVSVDNAGEEGDAASGVSAYSATISADGRYVGFQSSASNLVPDDTNGFQDIFVRDRQTGITERVSVDGAGNQANSESSWPVISGDGRYVAFYSAAYNLVPGDTNSALDAFVHDRVTGIIERISVNSAGTQGNSNSYYGLALSSDGRYAAFASGASNLAAGASGFYEVFLRDRQAGTTELVSVKNPGPTTTDSNLPAISADGRYVAFTSGSNNVVPEDTNFKYDVFVRDRQAGVTQRVSVDSLGAPENGDSAAPSISSDGRYVAFHSGASNFAVDDGNGVFDIFVHDRQTGVTERVSVDSSGIEADNGIGVPSISGDGRHVAFDSVASNLTPTDTFGFQDVFVHDRFTGLTERVSEDPSGDEGDNGSGYAALSGDGRYVAFQSSASNLVPDDTNGFQDVFVRDRQAAPLTPTPPPPSAVGGNVALPVTGSGSGPPALPIALIIGAALAVIVGGLGGSRIRLIRGRK